MKGIFEFEIGEKTVGFKFGTMALAITEQKEGKSLKSIFEALSGGKADTMLILHVLYGAAVQYTDSKRKPVDFSVSDVSDWIEEIGLEAISEVISEGFKQYVPKNSVSPTKMGEMITQ